MSVVKFSFFSEFRRTEIADVESQVHEVGIVIEGLVHEARSRLHDRYPGPHARAGARAPVGAVGIPSRATLAKKNMI